MGFNILEHLRPALGKTLISLHSNFGNFYPDFGSFCFEKNIQFDLVTSSLEVLKIGLEYSSFEIGVHDTYSIKPWRSETLGGNRGNVVYHLPQDFSITQISIFSSKDNEGRLIDEGHILFTSEKKDELFIRPLGPQCELWLWHNDESLDQFMKEQDLFMVDRI